MNSKIIFSLFLLLFLIPLPAYADDDAEEAIENLGWVAIGAAQKKKVV